MLLTNLRQSTDVKIKYEKYVKISISIGLWKKLKQYSIIKTRSIHKLVELNVKISKYQIVY